MTNFFDLEFSPNECDDITNRLHHALFHFAQGAADARAGRESMSAAAEFLADCAHINLFALGAHADTHFAIGKFLKENRHNHSTDGANVIDQAFVILGHNAKLGRSFETKTETGDPAISFETHR